MVYASGINLFLTIRNRGLKVVVCLQSVPRQILVLAGKEPVSVLRQVRTADLQILRLKDDDSFTGHRTGIVMLFTDKTFDHIPQVVLWPISKTSDISSYKIQFWGVNDRKPYHNSSMVS
jgi:hypothetical protein